MPDSRRDRIIKEALDVLGAVSGEGVSDVRVIIESLDSRMRIVYESTPGECSKSATRCLTEMQEDILEALANASVPITTKEIARVAGYSYSGPFRAALRDLHKRQPPLVLHDDNGYTLPPPTVTDSPGCEDRG